MFAGTFESEERSFKNRKTSLAAFITIALHALILLFLIWSILTPPDPPYTDSAGGVTVNFGNTDEGSGDVQPMTLTPIQADFSPAPAASQPAETKEDVVTQDLEDAPVIEKTKPTNNPAKPNTNPNTSNKPKNENPAPVQPKADPNALFTKGANGKPNNSTGDGTGNKPGDQGKQNGDPNSQSYLDGEGKGNGPGKGDLNGNVSLSGRSVIIRPKTEACNEKGTVIIDITVDRTGKVVSAKLHRAGSTLLSGCNVQNAINSAYKYKFNPDPQSDELQTGQIAYQFTIQ